MLDLYGMDTKEQRVPLCGIAEVKAGSDADSIDTAITKSISISEMLVYMNKSPEVGTPVSILIRFTQRNGKRPADIVQGVVTSISEIETFYCVGIRFNNELNAEDQPNLYPHLVDGE